MIRPVVSRFTTAVPIDLPTHYKGHLFTPANPRNVTGRSIAEAR